ncbi:MAG: hypothetical protein KAQ67_00005 [Gammaproteobacteria bacterium]|nr:hypothetical protein [Gammaproteobacteria bacterium]
MRISSNSQSGLSLIEAIIFILILSIALSAIISAYIYMTRYSANSMLNLRTVELSQALMDEILSKGYDENTPVGGGCVDGYASSSCTSGTTAQALLLANFGINAGETRSRFDDIDDYHNLAYCGAGVTNPPSPCAAGSCPATPNGFIDETETSIENDYSGYSICIQVSFAGNEINNLVATTGSTVSVNNNDAKRIDLIVSDPLNARLTYSAYKTNF